MSIDASTVIFFGGLIVAILLHEISHGVAALYFGDDTAKRAGRLTLNPVPHVDPFGTLILPAMGALTGLPVIGWAKPVPVNPSRLRKPRTQMFLVGLAGPVSNLLLAAGAVLVARALLGNAPIEYQFVAHHLPPGRYIYEILDPPLGFEIAYAFALVNVLLAVFNLIPVPPLDGSAIFELVMPDRWRPVWYRFRPYGLLVLFVLVFWTGLISTVISPFIRALDAVILA